MIKAGEERGTNPLTWQDGELMRTRGDDDRMIVVHHQGEGGGQFVLWVLFQGAALAWHGTP